jgi:hypothetical protein
LVHANEILHDWPPGSLSRVAAGAIERTIRISGRQQRQDASMSETTINIAPIFSVPLAITDVADSSAINADLEPLLLSRETSQYANPMPAPLLSKGVFESSPGVLQWPEPAMEKLRAALINAIGRLVAELGAFSQQEMSNVILANQTRFHITRHGGAFGPHNQPMVSWSAIYCVNPGDDVPDFPESGTVRILDQRVAACTYIDPGNARWRAPFGFGHASIKLRAGQIALFPAYVVREITTYLGQKPRITISSSFSFAMRAADAQTATPGA